MVNSIFEFGDIWKEDKGGMTSGKLKLTDQNIIFKNVKTGKVEQVNNGEVENVSWQRLGAGYGLRVTASNGNIYRFGGFQNDDKETDKLREFFKEYYRTDMKSRDISLTGRNWGTVNFDKAGLAFDIDKHNAFEIPLPYVSHCATAKNEVTLEFHQNDDAAINLMEMRFYIPTDANSEVDPVEAFKKNVLSKAAIIQATGDAIANFSDIQCLTPRGRYDIKIFTTFIQLHGKTFDYKIPVNTILRIFLLPHKDGRQMHFVLSLDPPIKQGQTRYHFLILLFNKDDEEDVSLSMSERDLKDKYEGKLEKEMNGPVFETLSRIVKAVVQRKVTTPGNYKSMNGTPAITCTYKSSYGLLYPLEKGFIYVHKPPVHIRFEEISSVNFARSGGSTRSFDIEVELRNQITHVFSSIEKDEYGRLYEYVKGKKLKIGNKQRGAEETFANEVMYDSDQEEDSGPDAYLHRVKNEAKQRDDDDDDDEDESDDDFNPDKASGGSDVGEEFDTDHDSTSSGSEGEGGEKGEKDEKKKKHKAKTVKEPGMSKKATKKSSKGDGDDKKRKKKGDKKDANAPKRPQSAYFLWMADNRERIKKENPGISITEIAKKGGEEWKALTDKSKWEKQNEALMEKWKRDVAEYQAKKNDDDNDDVDVDDDDGGSSKKKSPKKTQSTSGSGAGFKSKEYISSSGSDSDGERREKKRAKKPPSEKKGSSAEKKGSSAEKKDESFEALKSDDEEEEEILDSPEASNSEDEGSGSEEESMDEE